MLHTLAIHKVRDFTAWKSAFQSEESVALRKAAGEKSYVILRTIDDPNKFALLNEWQDMEKLKNFMQSEKLHKLQSASSIVEKPEIMIFGEAEKGSV
jgi:quinol monooxygenase YgiN